MRDISVDVETWPIAGAFTISRGSKTEAEVIVVTIRDGEHIGRGECVPYGRYGETVKDVAASIKGLSKQLAEGLSREELQRAMARGAGRNAIDCALWDLEAKITGTPAWQLAGLRAPQPCATAYTLSLDTPDIMREAARINAHRPLLKLKLGGTGDDIARVAAVRQGAPDATLIVDANEGWNAKTVLPMAHELAKFGVALIEQPLPVKDDEALRGLETPIPFCADESAHGLEGMTRLVGLYQYINIKLDKTGGLTEALSVMRCAKRRNLKIMVGCMVATSLAMAPAMLIAQDAEFIDLDGPLLLAKDREHGIRFNGSMMSPPEPELWG
ncbi:MAG: dipeptide epimerase [Parvibaculum sp.]|nr:dipeptide epimerase [Parvibaculum sp.]